MTKEYYFDSLEEAQDKMYSSDERMKYFNMGERVIVKATMYPFYIDGERKWLRKHLECPKEGFYVGYTYKQEGKLCHDRSTEETCLINIKSIKVLRVKFSDWGNDKFALLQDVRRVK